MIIVSYWFWLLLTISMAVQKHKWTYLINWKVISSIYNQMSSKKNILKRTFL